MKNTKTIILASIALLLAIFLGAAVWYKKSEATKYASEVIQQQDILVRPHAASTGPADAKVTLVEFLDPECESCRAFFPFVKQLLSKYPNDLRLVVRYAPFHPNAKMAIKIMEAARKQDKYWETMAVLFYYQPSWGDHHNPQPELMWNYLPEAGVDVEKIRADFDDPKVDELIALDEADLKALGVKATPTFFVNGQPLEKFGFEPLEEAIIQELK